MSNHTTFPWHAAEIASLPGLLETTPGGLSSQEAASRLRSEGPNRLPARKPPPLWSIFLRQFLSPPIYILLFAAVVSLFLSDLQDAIFIGAILLLNAGLGTYQEWKAERSSTALQQLLHNHASVQRDGEVIRVNAEELTPGDLVLLESGDRVPADMRLISDQGLEADESLLTGESSAVSKQAAWLGPDSTPLAERRNMVFAGAIILRGRGKGLVVATGQKTHVGRLAVEVLGNVGGQPPLVERMEHFARTVAYVVVAASVLTGVWLWAAQSHPFSEIFLFSVAVAVVAIPEGLPSAITVALAVATSRMARRGLIVRRLAAVEGLGSCSWILTDKTGTLTCNELTVKEVRLRDADRFTVTGEGFRPGGGVESDGRSIRWGENATLDELIRAAFLCNDGRIYEEDGKWRWRGDTVDIALIAFTRKARGDESAITRDFPRVHQIPFEPDRQYAISFHEHNGSVRAFVKGAPERVLSLCAGDSSTDTAATEISAAVEMAERGLRVLAFAAATLPKLPDSSDLAALQGQFQLLGLAGLMDPLRPGVKEAVRACHSAGVEVSMITGDHPATALTIARELGIAHDPGEVATGSDLSPLSPEELRTLIQRVRVFARVDPHQKLRIVNATRALGHFTAVTGDGVNDAPALRAANISIAMGQGGTDVARDTAELVLCDDNFSTIVAGIEEGRIVYDNIRKVVYLLVSIATGELFFIGWGIVTGLPLPLLPAQLLWLNLVTNGIQDVALVFEPGEGNVLRRRPRPPREKLFNRLMIERVMVAAIALTVISVVMFHGRLAHARSAEELAAVRNSILLLWILFEKLHIQNARSETQSIFSLSPLRNPIVLLGSVAALGVHILAMYVPLGQQILGTAPLSWNEWLRLIGAAIFILPVMEFHKWWSRRSHPGA